MSKKVEFFKTHQNIWVRGLGDLGTAFPPNNTSFTNLQMALTSEGIHMDFTHRGQSKILVIPYANIIVAELEKDQEVSVKLVKKEAKVS